jgi:hypothetical protein
LLLPTNESTTHSVIKQDVTTEKTSHNASIRAPAFSSATLF